jgi:siroheme synthase
MNMPGMFCGIGVGPGEPGLIPVIAWEFLKRCDVIFVPRATTMDHSVARQCLTANEIPAAVSPGGFTMDSIATRSPNTTPRSRKRSPRLRAAKHRLSHVDPFMLDFFTRLRRQGLSAELRHQLIRRH